MDYSEDHSLRDVEEPLHSPPLTKPPKDDGYVDLKTEGSTKPDKLFAAGLCKGTANTLEVCLSYIRHIKNT